MVILLNALSIFHQNLLNAKSIFTHQSIKATISPKRRDMPSARALKKSSFLKTKTKNAYDL